MTKIQIKKEKQLVLDFMKNEKLYYKVLERIKKDIDSSVVWVKFYL